MKRKSLFAFPIKRIFKVLRNQVKLQDFLKKTLLVFEEKKHSRKLVVTN